MTAATTTGRPARDLIPASGTHATWRAGREGREAYDSQSDEPHDDDLHCCRITPLGGRVPAEADDVGRHASPELPLILPVDEAEVPDQRHGGKKYGRCCQSTRRRRRRIRSTAPGHFRATTWDDLRWRVTAVWAQVPVGHQGLAATWAPEADRPSVPPRRDGLRGNGPCPGLSVESTIAAEAHHLAEPVEASTRGAPPGGRGWRRGSGDLCGRWSLRHRLNATYPPARMALLGPFHVRSLAAVTQPEVIAHGSLVGLQPRDTAGRRPTPHPGGRDSSRTIHASSRVCGIATPPASQAASRDCPRTLRHYRVRPVARRRRSETRTVIASVRYPQSWIA